VPPPLQSDMYAHFRDALTAFFAATATDARRVFHGRGHLFPGLEHICIDWYPPVVLISLYGEITSPDSLIESILSADKLQQIDSIILQKRFEHGAPAETVWGEKITDILVSEGSLQFRVRLCKQQNSGLFLDMRPLREWIQQNSRGKNVLNLFAYTCSLSVAALAGGARQVTNVDMSKTSINWGLENHKLNQQDPRQIKSIPHNIFRSWGRIKQFGRYDTIIIDPPTRQRGSFDAEKNYGAVLRKLGQLSKPGANVIATLNSPFLEGEFLLGKFEHHAPEFKAIEEMPVAPEFSDKFPERALKIFRFVYQAEFDAVESKNPLYSGFNDGL